MFKNIFTYLVCIIFFVNYISGSASGSSCQVHGVIGQCVPASECLSAKESVNGTLICSDQKETHVCCVSDPTPDSHTHTLTTRRSTDGCDPLTSLTAPEGGQKLWNKCLEYHEKIMRPCADIILVEGRFRISNCNRDTLTLILENGVYHDEYPHMVVLGYGDDINSLNWLCEGAIISERFILTFASCNHHYEHGPVTYIRTGVLNISEPVDTSRVFKVKRIIKHPSYKAPKPYNNIALLELVNDIPLDLSTMPACIDVGNLPSYTNAVAIGWDWTAIDKSVLQRSHLFEAPSDICVIPGARNPYDKETQICYENKHDNKNYNGFENILQVEHIKCMYVVTGLSVRHSTRYNYSQRPFTSVSVFVPWIESVVWP